MLRGEGAEDLRTLCIELAAHILALSETGDLDACRCLASEALSSGAALECFVGMVAAQGGDVSCVHHPEKLLCATHQKTVCAPREGYITGVDAEEYGVAALLLGAGRSKKEDRIDHTAGLYLHARVGDFVPAGAPVATLYTTACPHAIEAAAGRLLEATVIGDAPPAKKPLVLGVER